MAIQNHTHLSPLRQNESPFSNPEKIGSAPLLYLTAAISVAALAIGVFTLCPPVGIALMALSTWFLWCSIVIPLSHMMQTQDNTLAKTIHYLHAQTFEINTMLFKASFLPLTFSNRFFHPQGNPTGRPILMMHGYLSFGSPWYFQRKKLSEAGLGPIYIMNIGSFKSIEHSAGEVQKKVNEIKQETGRNDLALIGHSKGGLVGSYYATHLAAQNDIQVTDVITIGSPLAGAPAARRALGQDAEEMTPNHQFNIDLRRAIEQHPEIRFFHIASTQDQVVPLHSALLGEDHSRQKIFNNLGHSNLITATRTANQIIQWLQTKV